jgi:hypothetical protein
MNWRCVRVPTSSMLDSAPPSYRSIFPPSSFRRGPAGVRRIGSAVATVVLGVVQLLARTAHGQAAARLAAPEPQAAVQSGPPFAAPDTGHAWAAARIDSAIFVASNGGGVLSADTLTLQLDLGFAMFRADGSLGFAPDEAGHTRVAGSNLELSGLADIPIGPEHRLLIGGGMALPTARNGVSACSPLPTDTPCLRDAATRASAWAVGFRHAPAWADLSVTLWPELEYMLGIPWFLLHVDAAAPLFFPIVTDADGARWGGPQPLARGQVELMLTLELSAAIRLSTVVDIGATFLGWAIVTGLDAPAGCGSLCPDRHPQAAQGAISAFVRTDPQIDSPIGGSVELSYDLAPWWLSTSVFSPTFQPWALHFSLFGRFDIAA